GNIRTNLRLDLDVVTAAAKRVSQPLHPVFQVAVGKSSHARNERTANSVGDRLARLRILDFADFTPQDERQVAVIIAELTQPLLGDSINVMRSPAPRANQIASDEVFILQAQQSLAYGGSRHT